jgi:transcription elongation GreA/GreB family factor
MTTTMTENRVEFKKKVLAAARRKHEQVIQDFRQRIKDAMANDGTVNEEEYDNHQQSFKAGILAEVNLLNNELDFVNRELDEIRKIENFNDTVHYEVEFGSVVRTDKATFFVSASIERFCVGDDEILGLSVESPLYLAMKGKHAGDVFHYRDTNYLIKEIF